MDYSILVDVYESLESTSKRLEKTYYLSEFLKKVKESDVERIMLLIQGRVFPGYDGRTLGMASKLVIKALSAASGASADKVEYEWKRLGDLGDVSAELMKSKTQATLFSQKLTVKKVFDNLRKIAELEGTGTVSKKISLIAELLTSAQPKEAKYIIRTVLEDLRVGLGDGTIRDSLLWAYYGKKLEISYDEEKKKVDIPDREVFKEYSQKIQHAIDISNDFAEVTIAAKKGLGELKKISLVPGKPIKVMLYKKASGINDAFKHVGIPAAFEEKYDGFRMQVHKDKSGEIKIFTRSLDNVTKQFPEIVSYVKEFVKGDTFLLDAEAVGYHKDTMKYRPFQDVSQRIKRKYDIEDMIKKLPIELNVFDICYYDGKSLLDEPFQKRRNVIEKIVKNVPGKIKIAVHLITDSDKEAEKFYAKSLKDGNEGIMVKNLEGIYKPGSRVGFGVKVKPVMETLDVVIVGGEWGSGKRSKWISSFVVAIRDPQSNDFVEIGKFGTGVKEKKEEGTSFGEMTALLEPLITEEKGKIVRVKPKIVVEVKYEEIQKSPTYGSGFALRFPRFVRLRTDRRPEEISTLEEAKQLYNLQRGRND